MTEKYYPGRLIVLEGGDGAGKTTQLHLLFDRLVAAGVPVVVTREPGGCIAAEAIRRVVLSDIDINPNAEVLLHAAARIEHVCKLIRPALARGDFVVCDRFIDSTYAYQWAGRGADKALVDQMVALAGIDPDLVIVLDVSTDVGRSRVLARKEGSNRYDRADMAFRCRVREAFHDRAAAGGDRYAVIDADRPVAEVSNAIWQEVDRRFGPLVVRPFRLGI